MPKGKKKKFIDKKNAVVFNLIHRSQYDPLTGDANASRHVLMPTYVPYGKDLPADFPEEVLPNFENEEHEEFDPNADYDQDGKKINKKGDDGLYDYSQHMKPMGGGVYYGDDSLDVRNNIPDSEKDSKGQVEPPAEVVPTETHFGIRLPIESLPSEYELPVGHLDLLMDAGEQYTDELDLDMRQALGLEGEEAAEGFEELQDDFIFAAMGGDDDEEDEKGGDRLGGLGDLDYDDYGDYDEENETDDRPRRIIDDHFEAFMSAYDDDQIGELDEENPEVLGPVTDEQVTTVYDEVLDKYLTRKDDVVFDSKKTQEEFNTNQVAQVKRLVTELQDEDDDTASMNASLAKMFPVKPREQWDAESILSTYSNLENHPTLIQEPRKNKKKEIALSKKHGIPLAVLKERAEENDEKHQADDVDYDEDEDEDYEEYVNLGKKRNKKETRAEKKARKKALKAAKKERRQAKKQLKGLYKGEAKKQAALGVHQAKHNPPNVKTL